MFCDAVGEPYTVYVQHLSTWATIIRVVSQEVSQVQCEWYMYLPPETRGGRTTELWHARGVARIQGPRHRLDSSFSSRRGGRVQTTFEDHASRFHKPAVLHWGWDVWAATIAIRYLKDGRHAYLMKVDAHLSSISHVLHSRHLTLRIRATGFVEIGG